MNNDESCSVLIVDDSIVMQQYFYKLFSSNGFIVKGLAENGHDAVNKYKMLNPDIVIMDETMPGMSGLHAMQRIIEYDYDAEVVILTGLSTVDSNLAFARGASAFFDKPVEDKELFIKTCKELAKKRADQRQKDKGKIK